MPDDEKKNPDEYRLTVRLDLDTQTKWENFADENPTVNSKSELVRRSVSEFIRREEERGDGELTKEQKEIVDVIRNENARVLTLAEDIKDVAERMDEKQITAPEHREISYEAVAEANQRQTNTILTQLDDFTGSDDE
jgi:predicted transcriptional regulator